ncbi:ABC transporter permease subunit [Nitrospirales bacterium NOB]|nr:ABC transporter permease subunit [Nitrospirales bacterium NOB]
MFRRFVTFASLYLCGVLLLLAVKAWKTYPDYVIPGPTLLSQTFSASAWPYCSATVETVVIALVGHILSTWLAFLVGTCVALLPRLGALLRQVAYTIQSYPLIATAPIFFILLGNGMVTRLVITASICYFPMLLMFIGSLSTPVMHVEHFYRSCWRLTSRRLISIRLLENMQSVVTTVSGAFTLAVVGAVLAEFLSVNSGIGYAIRAALYRNRLDSILIALLFLGMANCLVLAPLDHFGRWIVSRTTGSPRST